jgi:hypothetical protein
MIGPLQALGFIQPLRAPQTHGSHTHVTVPETKIGYTSVILDLTVSYPSLIPELSDTNAFVCIAKSVTLHSRGNYTPALCACMCI